jgi:hypothetical protein
MIYPSGVRAMRRGVGMFIVYAENDDVGVFA